MNARNANRSIIPVEFASNQSLSDLNFDGYRSQLAVLGVCLWAQSQEPKANSQKLFAAFYVPVLSPALVGLGAMVFILTGLAGMPTAIVYGSMSLVATPIDPTRPCSCTRTPLMTVG